MAQSISELSHIYSQIFQKSHSKEHLSAVASVFPSSVFSILFIEFHKGKILIGVE